MDGNQGNNRVDKNRRFGRKRKEREGERKGKRGKEDVCGNNNCSDLQCKEPARKEKKKGAHQ